MWREIGKICGWLLTYLQYSTYIHVVKSQELLEFLDNLKSVKAVANRQQKMQEHGSTGFTQIYKEGYQKHNNSERLKFQLLE